MSSTKTSICDLGGALVAAWGVCARAGEFAIGARSKPSPIAPARPDSNTRLFIISSRFCRGRVGRLRISGPAPTPSFQPLVQGAVGNAKRVLPFDERLLFIGALPIESVLGGARLFAHLLVRLDIVDQDIGLRRWGRAAHHLRARWRTRDRQHKRTQSDRAGQSQFEHPSFHHIPQVLQRSRWPLVATTLRDPTLMAAFRPSGGASPIGLIRAALSHICSCALISSIRTSI